MRGPPRGDRGSPNALVRKGFDPIRVIGLSNSFRFSYPRSRGKQAIREAFAPQFRGDFGRIRFQAEDLFVDPESGKALIRWLCTLEREGRSSGWRGLDILRFEDGLLAEKHTYAKAEIPLILENA